MVALDPGAGDSRPERVTLAEEPIGSAPLIASASVAEVAPTAASAPVSEVAPIASLTLDFPEPVQSMVEPPEPSSVDETDPAPDMQAKPAEVPAQDEPTLGAIVKETWVFAKPSWGSRKLGYLRAGAVVTRESKSAGRAGCEKGWYRIAPRGYVCVGDKATIDVSHPVLAAAARRPDRTRGLPYDYVMSRNPPPPLYVRLPSEDEQKEIEGEQAVRPSARVSSEGLALGPIPGALLYGDPAPALSGPKHARETLLSGRPVARSGFALLEAFDWTGRAFGLTTDMNVIPLDRTRLVKASSFKGIVLQGEEGLPAAFVRSRQARRYSFDPVTRHLRDAGPVAYREGVALTGKQMRLGGGLLLETRDGTWIREGDNVLLIPRMRTMPGWAAKGRKWVDISILRQTLVAYEGTRPVYATLVSTGADGLGDPEKTHSTVQGVFQIHTKHVTSTMDGDQVGDEFDLRDVPYVQYFHEGYALHASYWHDDFGTPHSHGCVNLAPQDAAWLFAWSDPQVPEGWHGYLQPHGGAIVYTHP